MIIVKTSFLHCWGHQMSRLNQVRLSLGKTGTATFLNPFSLTRSLQRDSAMYQLSVSVKNLNEKSFFNASCNQERS